MTIDIKENVPLAEFTTFKIGGPARFFCRVSSEEGLLEAVSFAKSKQLQLFVLGGGSNVLISDAGIAGLVVKMEMMGVRFGQPQDGIVIVTASAGEMWDELVGATVERGLYGLENLSAIPGTVGAAPVQNIGAYGSDVSRTILSVRAFDTVDHSFKILSNADCQFGYRDSLFKREKGRYIVTSVDLKLSKVGEANLSYKEVQEYLARKGIKSPTLDEVRQAVVDIRWNKLPDWKLWGTAGSFFKNPVVSAERFAELAKANPGLPGFPEQDGRIKVSLGWILDKLCGVKGLCMGKACVYEKQALVLVTLPGAKAEEVAALSRELMERVKEKTGLDIEGEVEWVN